MWINNQFEKGEAYTKANELYNGSITTNEIINDINYWVYGNDEYHGYFDTNNFYSFLKDLFLRESTNGFADWKYIKYFLYEYELAQTNQMENDDNWNKMSSIEPVLPFKQYKTCWRSPIRSFTNLQKKQLSGSLGNLLLTSHRNRFEDELCFEDKKRYYSDGSLNELEISKFKNWNELSILKRGLKMIDFMEERWKIKIGDIEDKKKLLFLDFLDEG
ncbi:GmrSD restriction endonuclease domain-containing protein [Tenacibaculum maritimum]|uniref:GmrSD restriction endonuclease domain-containing protein n=1 Tax=Tenacibaculum maritimum TaxID=107401 RepID=UPI001330900E|nr:DUF1524 domain-containing protein [Tenacibaculum maritimum]